MKTRHRHHRRRHSHKGAGYGFGGSILSNDGGANAGNVLWNPNSDGFDPMKGADSYRAGNGAFAGGRRRTRRRHRGGDLSSRGGNNAGAYVHTPLSGVCRRKTRRTRRRHRGGMLSEAQLRAGGLNPALVQGAPRTGYTFNGSGVAGMSDPVRLNG